MFGAGRYDAIGDYQKAIDFWHQYDPTGNPQKQSDKDGELLTALSRSITLLNKSGDTKAAEQHCADIYRFSQSYSACNISSLFGLFRHYGHVSIIVFVIDYF